MVQNCLLQGVPVRKQPVRLTGKAAAEKDNGIQKSERLLLTWLVEYPKLFPQISAYVTPEDFSDELYRSVARMLYEQLSQGAPNPARITSQFDEPEQQRQIAQIFNTEVRVETPEETKKAIRESMQKVMEQGIEQRAAAMDPTDIAGMQAMITAKNRIRGVKSLNISL
jgi:DNA primase